MYVSSISDWRWNFCHLAHRAHAGVIEVATKEKHEGEKKDLNRRIGWTRNEKAVILCDHPVNVTEAMGVL